MWNEVSMTVYMDRIANQRKIPNGCYLKTTSQNHQIFDAHVWGTCLCICVPNMKMLCLTLCQGDVWSDDDADPNDDGAWWKASLVDKPNEPKKTRHKR